MQMKPQKFLEMLNLNFISLILEHRVFYSSVCSFMVFELCFNSLGSNTDKIKIIMNH